MYNKYQQQTYNFHKNSDTSHLKRMSVSKLRYVYHFVLKEEATDIPHFQMLHFLLTKYPKYCKSIKKGIISSYKHKDDILLIGV